MTGAQLANKIRYYTKTSSATFTDADMLPIVNSVKDDLASQMSLRNENLFVAPALDNLVADQREYAIPDDILNNLVSVECAFQTASPLSYVFVEPTDYTSVVNYLRSLGLGFSEAHIVSQYSNVKPSYFIQRRSVYLLSGTIVSVTNGIRFRYRVYPADLSAMSGSTDLATDPSTTSFGVPRQFHELWARGVSIIWKSSHPKPVALSPLEMKYEQDLLRALDQIAFQSSEQEIIASIPAETGSNF